MNATALMAEDEPLLAADLKATLNRIWPALDIVAVTGDGQSAATESLRLKPDVLFLDIRMPGMTGLECAQALTEDWSEQDGPFPLIVFVTAYDQYAVQAFERAAFDYVLKPVDPARLQKTCARLQAQLAARADKRTDATSLGDIVSQMRHLLSSGDPDTAGGGRTSTPLRIIQASSGNTISMVRVDDVIYFESADKYVRVVTASQEHLIRMSLKELIQGLDPDVFWQVHRGSIVRCDAIAAAERDESGKLTLRLRDHADRLTVSRLYADRFRGM